MEQQSKQDTSDGFPPELEAQAIAAFDAEKQSVDKGVEAWKKCVTAAPTAWAPRRELARVYRTAERWNALIEVLREAVEKSTWATPEEKLPVLFEMVEVYRDRLKLDVMVVNTFTQILNIQPGNLPAVDALAAQYEAMKRWPDLISVLRRKATVVEDAAEKVALHLKVANLFLEKFSNQAEAIKAFEAILELEPTNPEAIGFLKQMYDKRRDWEKLIAVHQREIETITDPAARQARRVEVAKLASEKLKKPSVCIELWRAVVADNPENAEGLAELEKLYEREKAWAELGEVLEKQVAIAGDPVKKSATLVKLGILFTEKVQAPERAVAAWQTLLGMEPENRRAQDALKKLYIQQKNWGALEQFYAAQNKWDELVRVLERQSEVEDDASRVGLWLKVGELYRDRLAKNDKAQKAFEKTLLLDAHNLGAAEALIPMYEAASDARHLADVLLVQLEHTTEPAVRLDRMQRLTGLLDGQVGDKAAALGIALKAFSEHPLQDWPQEQAVRLADEAQGWQQLAEVYEAALAQVGDDAKAITILGTLATGYEKHLGQPETAIERNQRILAVAPKHEEAVAALERLYVITERFADLMAIYDKKLELAKTVEQQLEVRFKLARLYETEGKKPKEAIDLYKAILDQDDGQVEAVRALGRIYTGLEKWKDAAKMLEREIQLTGEPAAISELKFRLGGLREQHLNDAEGAVDCYREALAMDPAHAGARESLQAYLTNDTWQMAAVAVLEPIYEQNDDTARLVQVQRIKLQHEKDKAARVALFLRIGALESKLSDTDKSWEAFAAAFGEDASSQEAREALENMAAVLDNWAALVSLYETALAGKSLDPKLQRELLLVVAVAYDEKLGQSEKAVECFRRAQEILPEDASALEALERLYTRTERWSDLIETLKRKAELVTEPAEREIVHARIATVWEEMLSNAEEAIAAWKEVLGDNSDSMAALKALDRLYLQRGEFRELADNVQRQLQLASEPAVTVALLGRLGELREQKLGEPGAAVETYRQILDIEPEHAETVTALERILPNPDHELQVAQLLEPVYKSRNDWQSLIATFEVQARHALAPDQKIALLQQIAEGYEVGLDDPEHAYDALGRALKEDPQNPDTQHKIDRLARVLGKLEDLVARLGEIVVGLSDTELQRQLYHKIATLNETDLGRDEQAAAAYAKALEVAPADLEAANALEQIYLRGGDYPNLVQLLMRKSRIIDDPEEKKQLCFKAAQIYEEVLENPEQAIDVFRQVLAIDETDGTALDNLERLYIRLSRWNDLKDVYAKKAELASDPESKKQMLHVLGQVYDRELQSPERAIETYSSIMDIDPDDLAASQQLDRLYVQTQRWYDLLAILERQTELVTSGEDVVALRFRIGELWREHLKDLSRAVEAYRTVLGMDPMHEPTMRALEALMAGPDDPVLAAQVLEPLYETAGEWDKVVAVYEVMVAHGDDPAAKVELLCKIAELQERRLSNAGAAFEAYGRALRFDSSNVDVLAHLERLADETGSWPKLAELYSGELEKILDSARQVDMLLRLARVYEEQTNETELAIGAYKRVSEVDPESRDGLVSLDRLYSRTQRWQELADVVRQEIRIATSDGDIVALTFRLAQIYETAIADLPKAVEAYRDILNADPAHADTRASLERLFMGGSMQMEIAEILEPLYRLGEEWEKLVQIYNVQLAKLTDVTERQNLLRRLAEIAEQKLFDQVSAFEWWATAAKEDPTSEQAMEELLRLARSTHQWEGWVNTMNEAASPERDARVRRDVLMRLAAGFETDLTDLERAEQTLQRVLQEQPKDAEALAAIDRIYTTLGMHENLAGILRRRIEITDDSSDLVALHLRLGRVCAEALDDPDAAVKSYLAVLEQESRSVEALGALERLYFRRENWEELFGVYEKLVDVAQTDDEIAECYAHMAKLASDALFDRERATELWGRVIDMRGDDVVALGALADLREQAEEWQELTEVLEQQVFACREPEQKIAIYKRLGRVWGEKLSRDRNSLEAWQKALELDPTDVESLRAICANYRSAGAWEELSESLRRLIQVGMTNGTALHDGELKALYSELGELEGETLMRTQAAIDAWRAVLDIEGTDARALASLERLFMQEARWEEAVEILERRAQNLANPNEQVEVLMQAASLWADKIGDGGSAADVYERVLQIEPTNMQASTELEGLYRQRKSWVKLIDLLIARTEFVGDVPAKIQLLQQAAEIYEQQLGDRESAFITLQAAFREDYSNDSVAKELERLATAIDKWNELLSDYTQVVQGITESKQAADLWVKIARWYDSALNHLEYAIASAQQALTLDPTHVGALGALEDFFRKQARWNDLVSALSRHAEVEQDTQQRIDILLQLAETYEVQIGDGAQATVAYQRALDSDERCLDAINALERLYRRVQAWDRLVEVLTKKAQVVEDGELAVKLRVQVGELWEERLGDNERAIEAYREVLSVDSQNLPALKALERLYERTGKMEAYLENLEHQLEILGSAGERVETYQRMATVWEDQFQKLDRAAEVLEKILLVDEKHLKAYRDLERLYTADKKWDSLVDTYRRHILITADNNERVDLYMKMGQCQEEQLRDPDRAIEAFSDVLTFNPDHQEALAGLARLYEQIEQWERAVDVMRRLVKAIDDPRQKVDLNFRLGRIHDEHMNDSATAEEYLVEALSSDPTHVPSMVLLINIYKQRGDWLKAAQTLIRAEACTQNPLEKTRLLFEAGKIAQERLGDEIRAMELYARTLELDPEHVEAAEPLAELYFNKGEWAPLVPVLEMLARKADKKSNKELTQLQFRLAKACDKLEDHERALRYYKQAYDLDPTHLPTLVARADLLYRREHWDEAFKIYQTILVHHRDTQSQAEIVEIFYRLGRIKLKVGERTKAINMFEKALEIDAGHRATLEALIDIYTEAADFEAVIKQKRALITAAGEVDEKFTLLGQIAEIYKDKRQNPQKAIACYLEAMELKPDEHQLLHNLLDLFGETKQWKKAIEILQKLADLEKGQVKAKYLTAAGNIANYELHATDEAVEFYNLALDEDPDDLKTFERIDKIMTAKKDWKNQERNYRKMIKRMGQEPPADKKPTQIALWHALGEIYRSRLKDFKTASEAFEVCVRLDNTAAPRHVILAELYEVQGAEMYPKAINEYRHLIKVTDDFGQMAVHMKKLNKLFMELRQYDRAWCTCSALAFLHKAEPQEQQFFEQYRPKGFSRARARLTEELWQKSIYHPDEDRYISTILASVSQAVLGLRAKEHKDYGLRRKDRRDLATDQLLFSKVFNYVAQVLGTPQPELYLRPESPGELDLANCREKQQLLPSFVVGTNLLQGRPEKELGYAIGKRLSLMRPDHLMRWPSVVPTVAEMRVVFLAALKLVQPSFAVKPELAQPVGEYLKHLERLVTPQMREQLVVVVQKFIATKAEADINRWARAVDFTTTRAGFLICNDMDVAARLVQSEPVAVGLAEPKEKIRDLISWSLSDEYFALREHLGLVIGQG